MSSIRVAVGSCVLVLALGASAWGAVQAFPLYGEWREEQAVRDPQRPARDPISADAHHRAAVGVPGTRPDGKRRPPQKNDG